MYKNINLYYHILKNYKKSTLFLRKCTYRFSEFISIFFSLNSLKNGAHWRIMKQNLSEKLNDDILRMLLDFFCTSFEFEQWNPQQSNNVIVQSNGDVGFSQKILLNNFRDPFADISPCFIHLNESDLMQNNVIFWV